MTTTTTTQDEIVQKLTTLLGSDDLVVQDYSCTLESVLGETFKGGGCVWCGRPETHTRDTCSAVRCQEDAKALRGLLHKLKEEENT